MNTIKFFDSTLRDGSHAVKQQISGESIERYCRVVDYAGMYTIIVGHGNGIGASSIHMGMSAIDEIEMLSIARRNIENTRLGTFVTVGFGTIEKEIRRALDVDTNLFCIATHCTEADTMKKHISYLALRGIENYGVLMNIHLSTAEKLLEEAKKVQDYGADGIILMDSAGASTPETVKKVVNLLAENLQIDVGFHPHNNLGLAVANAYTAIQNGATIIDGTIGGFGAGAGNCQLEALQALLQLENIETEASLYRMIDAADVIREMFSYMKMVDGVSIISGYAGVVSTFKHRVVNMAEQYNVDPRDVFIELGKRRAISGQDDLILEIILDLCRIGECECK